MKNKYIESMKYGFIVTGMIVIVFFIGYCLFKVMGVYFAFLVSSLGIFEDHYENVIPCSSQRTTLS